MNERKIAIIEEALINIEILKSISQQTPVNVTVVIEHLRENKDARILINVNNTTIETVHFKKLNKAIEMAQLTMGDYPLTTVKTKEFKTLSSAICHL